MKEIFPEIQGLAPKTAEKAHRPDKMRNEMEVPHHATFRFGFEYPGIIEQDRQGWLSLKRFSISLLIEFISYNLTVI